MTPVDDALAAALACVMREASGLYPSEAHLIVLAAEVRALREELAGADHAVLVVVEERDALLGQIEQAEGERLGITLSDLREKHAGLVSYVQQLDQTGRTVKGILKHALDEFTAKRYENCFDAIVAALGRLPKD